MFNLNQQNGKIISRRPTRSDHIIISSCSLWRRMARMLYRESWDDNRAQRNPSTVLKRNYANKQQVSLFWIEPALGDAVISCISSVRSESRPDSSHQKACLLKISHMTAGGAKAAVPPCDTPAAARCCAVRRRPCLVVSPARVMLCVMCPLSLSLPRSEAQPRSMLCVKQSCLVLWTAIFLPLAALASSCVDVSRS